MYRRIVAARQGCALSERAKRRLVVRRISRFYKTIVWWLVRGWLLRRLEVRMFVCKARMLHREVGMFQSKRFENAGNQLRR